ncbi:hypothetical protein EON64_13265, partial [archaeon]
MLLGIAVDQKTTRALFEVQIPPDADPGLVHNNSSTNSLRFEFDEVFGPEASQQIVFDKVAAQGVLEGLEGL